MRKLIEENVSCIVVRLLHRANDSGEGGEINEVLKRNVERRLVQIPRSEHFRKKNSIESLLVEIVDELVLKHHSTVDHANQRSFALLNVCHNSVDVFAAGNVAAGIHHRDTLLTQFFNSLDSVVFRSGAAHQSEVTGAIFDHPMRQFETESSGTTSDQVGPVGTKAMTFLGRLTDLDVGDIKVEDVLSDVLSSRHVAECLDHFGNREHFIRKWLVNFIIEHFLQIGEHLSNILWLVLEVLREVDHEEADIVAKRFKANLRIAVDIDLSDLHVATKSLQHTEVLRNKIAGKGVENGINTFAIGDSHDLIRELESSRVEHIVDTHIAKELPLLRCSCRREYGNTKVLGNLDSSLPHPTGSGVDENALAFPHPRELVDGVVRREKDSRKRRSLDVAHRVRLTENHIAMHRNVAAEAIRCHTDNIVARLQVLHIGTNTDDGSREIITEPFQVDRIARIYAERLHDVTEVDTAGFDLDFNLVRVRIAARRLVQREVRENTGLVDLETIWQNRSIFLNCVLSAWWQVLRFDSVNSTNQTAVSAESDFVLVFGES